MCSVSILVTDTSPVISLLSFPVIQTSSGSCSPRAHKPNSTRTATSQTRSVVIFCFFFRLPTELYGRKGRGKMEVPGRTLWVGAHFLGYVFESRVVIDTWTA
jgi:hypothetical protein